METCAKELNRESLCECGIEVAKKCWGEGHFLLKPLPWGLVSCAQETEAEFCVYECVSRLIMISIMGL